MAALGAHDVDALYAHDQALSDPQRGAAEKRASMQSLLSAVRSESAPGNYTCLAFQLLANHAGAHPDQMVGVTPRLVKVCESEAANRMVRVQAARSLATIYKALKGDRQVKLRSGITKVVEGTTDSLLVRELLPCLDGLAVTPGSKVGVATIDSAKPAAAAKATPTATAAVTAAPPAKPTPSPAAPSPVPPPTAKAVSPLVKPAPAPAEKPKAEPKPATTIEQTQVQNPQVVIAGNRLVTPPPVVTTAEELPAYLKTLPPGVAGRLTQCLGGSLNLQRNGIYFDQLAKAAGCDEVPIATLARVAKPQFSGRRLMKSELRQMHTVLVRALGEGSAEGQGAEPLQVQVQAAKEAPKETLKEAPKQALTEVEQENRKQARKAALQPAVITPSEAGNSASEVPIVTDRPAALSKQEPAKQAEEGRPAVALSIDSPSPYLVIRELPSHVSASMVMALLERAGVQTLDLAYLSLARDGESAMAMLHFRDVARAALVKERLDGRPFSENKRGRKRRGLRLAFTVGPPTRTVCLMHLYGLHGEAVRQLIDNRSKGLERLDINRGRPGDGMECAEATFATPTQAAYLVRSLTTQPHHVMGPRGRPVVATFSNPLPAFPPPSDMDHSPRNGQDTANARSRSLSPPPRQAKEIKGQSERRRDVSPPRRSRSRDRGGDSNAVDRKRELDRSEGHSDRRDGDRKRRDGRGRSPPRPLPSPSPAPIRRRRRGEDTDDEQDDEDARLARQDDARMEAVEEEERQEEEEEDRASVASEVMSTSSPRRDDASPRRPHSPASEARDTQEPSQSDDRSRSPSPARSEGGFRSLGGDSSDDEDARSVGRRDEEEEEEEEDKKSDGGFRSLGGDSSSDEEDTQRPVDREGREGANGSSHRRDPSPLPAGRRLSDRPERRASPPRRPIGRSRSRERLTSDRRPLPSTTDKGRAPRRSPPPRPRAPLTEPNRPIDPPRDDRPKSPLRQPSSTVGRGEWPPRRLQPSMGSRSPPTADRDRQPFGQDPPPSLAHAIRRGGPEDKRGEDRAPRRSPPRPLPSSAPAGARGGKGMSPGRPIEARDMGGKWEGMRGMGGNGPAPLSDRGFRPMDPGPFPGRSKRSRSPPMPRMDERRDGPPLKRRGGFADGPRHAPEAGHYGPPMGMQMQKAAPPLIGRGTGTLETAQPPALRGRGDFQGPYGPSDGPRNMPHQHGSGPGGDFVNHYGPASHSNRGGHGRGRSPPRSRRPRT